MEVPSEMEEIRGVAIVISVLQVESAVGLGSGALVMKGGGPLLVVVAAQLLHMPDGQPRGRKSSITARLVAVLDNEILRTAPGMNEEVVAAGWNRRIQTG